LPGPEATRKGAPAASNIKRENDKNLSIAVNGLYRKIMSKPKKYASEGAEFILEYDPVSADFSEEKLRISIIKTFGLSLCSEEVEKKI
jgi:hypothetical protein